MQRSLVLLILMGQGLFLVCPLHVYHFIAEPKTWKEAQCYCRENYTDLATVCDMNDTQRLKDSVNTQEAWIGLYNVPGKENRVWHWSRPGVEVTKYFWADNQPNDNNGDSDNCVVIKNNEWDDHKCSHRHYFICYDDKKPSGEQYIFYNDKKTETSSKAQKETSSKAQKKTTSKAQKKTTSKAQKKTTSKAQKKTSSKAQKKTTSKAKKKTSSKAQKKTSSKAQKKTWSEAQKYCRKEHTDLVSGLDQLLDRQLRRDIQNHKTRFFWIGLFRDGWRWSDGSDASFRNWESFKDDNSGKCAVTLLPSQKWDFRACSDKKPFFCYKEENMILITERKTWENASEYCIENHHGLVSITDPSQQRWAGKKAEEANTGYVWVGMRYTCVLDLWFWVNDELVCYKNWVSDQEPVKGCDRAVAMSKREGHKWHAKADTEEFNFICALH